MKKNMEAVSVDRNLTVRLIELLQHDSDSSGAELSCALSELLDGSCSSLILDLNDAAKTQEDHCIHYGKLTINTSARKITKNGQDIALTPKEYDILCLLARNRGHIFTKEQIYRTVWDDDFYMDSSNIMSFIRKIRKKIEQNPDNPEYIQTVWGIGYRFGDPD